jgi:hypothetical protein
MAPTIPSPSTPMNVQLPAQVKLPVAPSTVHPVAPEPPAILTEVAVAPSGPIFSVDAAPPKLIVVAVALSRLKLAAEVVISPPLTAKSPPKVRLLNVGL